MTANWGQARWMTAGCEIASQKLKPVAEGVPLAGEGMYHDSNRRHGELQPHDADRQFIASGAEIQIR